MGNKQTQIHAQSPLGNRVQVTQHESDSPILPVAQLERLHAFRPDLVDWVVSQTKSEASERWSRQKRVDWFILAERVGGLLCGFSIALVGLGLAAYLALQNREITAGIIAGGTLVGIVAVLVQGRKVSAPEQSGVKPSEKKR